MSHERIESEEWVERYVRRRLTARDNSAFEDHYFQCDRCFADVEEMERFISGVRATGRRGLLNAEAVPARWLMPAFAFALATAVLLGAGLSYMTLVRAPENETQLRAALDRSARNESQLAESSRHAASETQANIPVVILTANRAAGDAPDLLRIDPQTRMALLWIDIPPQPPGAKFRIAISSPGGAGKTVHGLERNENGALAAGIPIDDLAPGTYLVRLYPEQGSDRMMAEYRMAVTRK